MLIREKLALNKNYLIVKNWKIFDYIRDFLRNFYNVIKVIEGRRNTLEDMIFIMNFLINTFENAV